MRSLCIEHIIQGDDLSFYLNDQGETEFVTAGAIGGPGLKTKDYVFNP